MRRRHLADVQCSNNKSKEKHSSEKMAESKTVSRWKSLLGFKPKDLTSWTTLVRLLNEPRDPASLAITRILFGVLMMIDIPQERGMANLDARFGDLVRCQFPLFDNLTPLPVDWMYMMYLIMFSGALGICLGLFYRVSCAMFFIPYWYVFLLDKTSWNNHSYLYGLLGFQLTFMDANRCWSLDSLFNSKVRNRHVPLWNYTMLRGQIFIVYFIAGLKKLDLDWMAGYSMSTLSRSSIFDPFNCPVLNDDKGRGIIAKFDTMFSGIAVRVSPFNCRLLLTEDQIDLYIIHIGGLALDLFGGWLLFFDRTRPMAFFLVGMFHTMNSQLFSIGMFPYAMLATMPIFCYADWPRLLFARCPVAVQKIFLPVDGIIEQSDHCIYPDTQQETGAVQDIPDKTKHRKSSSSKSKKAGWYHHIASCWLIFYFSVQFFLPYSHFITKGYNNWTSGLYGYSWDMMIHNWSTQHIKIKYVEKGTGEEGYLAPEFFSHSSRWASHADMLKQYAMCVSNHLHYAGLKDVELYFDIWKSMNGRFQQRMWNPLENMVDAEWTPFKTVPWAMPLLTDLSDWRTTLLKIEDELGEDVDVTFVADFPGLFLENFLSEDFDNASLTVLSGKVKVELIDKGVNVTLTEGQKVQLPVGAFHNVHTISTQPSTFMYLFVNGTAVEYHKNIAKALEKAGSNIEDLKNGDLSTDTIANITDQELAERIRDINSENKKTTDGNRNLSMEKASRFLNNKAQLLRNTLFKTTTALGHVLFGLESVMESVKKDMEPRQDNGGSQHSHASGNL